MDLENLWYESSPYVYVAGGSVSLVAATSLVSVLFPILLIAVATRIMRLRWKYRHRKQANQRARNAADDHSLTARNQHK